MAQQPTTQQGGALTNGRGAAAILAAGIGCAVLGVLALANDASKSFGKLMVFSHPTGGLSGVTTTTIIVWLVAWYVLNRAWRARSVNLGVVSVISFAGLVVGALLTFPPVMDLLQGK